MKKVLLGLAVLLSASLSVRVEAADKKTVVATAGDIKPFSYQNKKGQLRLVLKRRLGIRYLLVWIAIFTKWRLIIYPTRKNVPINTSIRCRLLKIRWF